MQRLTQIVARQSTKQASGLCYGRDLRALGRDAQSATALAVSASRAQKVNLVACRCGTIGRMRH